MTNKVPELSGAGINQQKKKKIPLIRGLRAIGHCQDIDKESRC